MENIVIKGKPQDQGSPCSNLRASTGERQATFTGPSPSQGSRKACLSHFHLCLALPLAKKQYSTQNLSYLLESYISAFFVKLSKLVQLAITSHQNLIKPPHPSSQILHIIMWVLYFSTSFLIFLFYFFKEYTNILFR